MAKVKLKAKASEDPKDKKPASQIVAYKGGVEKTPTGKSSAFVGDLGEYLKVAEERGLDTKGVKSASELQGRIYDKLMQTDEGKKVLKNMWSEYGVTKKGGGGKVGEPISDEQLSGLKTAFTDSKLGGRTKQLIATVPSIEKIPPPKETPKEEPEKEEEMPSTKFAIQGRLPYGKREPVMYYPKSIEDFNKLQGILGTEYSVERKGAAGEAGAGTRYEMSPSEIEAKLGKENMSLLGEAYMGTVEKGGASGMRKLRDLQSKEESSLRAMLEKKGIKGAQLEKELEYQRQQSPYRNK